MLAVNKFEIEISPKSVSLSQIFLRTKFWLQFEEENFSRFYEALSIFSKITPVLGNWTWQRQHVWFDYNRATISKFGATFGFFNRYQSSTDIMSRKPKIPENFIPSE